MTITASLTPERDEQHRLERAQASLRVLMLARDLQRAAFHGRFLDRMHDPMFEPAPVYLSQATAIAGDGPLFDRVLGHLAAIAQEG